MKTIILKGISGRGKNRIQEHGADGNGRPNPMRNPPNGCSVMLESVKTGDRRWLTDHFKVV